MQFNVNLQYLRAVAALAVLLYHTAHYVGAKFGPGLYDVFHHFLGLYGVAIFFALSGYLMAELSVRQTAPRFLAARVIRIYPALLLATALAIAFDPSRVLKSFDWLSLTLIPAGHISYALNVEWTLVHEMFFYILVTAVIFTGLQRHLPLLALVWLAILALYASTPLPRIGRADLHTIVVMQANVAFAAGLLIPSVVRIGLKPPLLLVGVFLAAIPISYVVPSGYARFVAGIGSACLVAWAVQLQKPLLKGRVSTVTNALGDWSYAIYLIHVPAVLLALRVLPDGTNKHLVYVLCVTAAMIASFGLAKADVSMHTFLRRHVQAMPDNIVAARVIAFVAGYFILSLLVAGTRSAG